MGSPGKQNSPVADGALKLLFFALTFVAFIALQNAIPLINYAWVVLMKQLVQIPLWVVFLAAVGVLCVGWLILLGLNECLARLLGRGTAYDRLDCDEETGSDSLNTVKGRSLQEKFSREKSNASRSQAPAAACRKPGRGGSSGGGGSAPAGNEADGDSDGQPTDVDVTVHPVDTTLAAGGEAFVSPTYNVSLLNFGQADAPAPPAAASRLYPSAPPLTPSMHAAPATFNRSF